MQLLHSRNSWYFSHGFNMMVDFCIWTLEVDGLHVPPFEQHPDGDASLRTAGLTAQEWLAWLVRVVDTQYTQQQRFQKRSREYLLHGGQPPVFPSEIVAHQPVTAWMGNEAVGTRLATLWEEYGPISNRRRDWEGRLTHRWQKADVEASKHQQHLYNELSPYHARIPTMIIHLVNYEQPLNYLLPPVSVIMTAQSDQPDAPEFRERVLDAAAGLSAIVTPRRHEKSTYRLSPYSIFDKPTPRYKLYPRVVGQVPPPPEKVYIVAENETKQVVLDELNDRSFRHGDINMQTVTFLKEKAIPGWLLYHISYEEMDGEKHYEICLLQQQEDSSWRFMQGGTGGQFRETAAQLFPHIHDHPLLSLSGGMSATFSADGTRQYMFTAHGEIIDNGFNVTRVRLTNEDGQVFEDTVQDGLILFASVQRSEVRFPMQAELFDSAGKLVWRETVLDFNPRAGQYWDERSPYPFE